MNQHATRLGTRRSRMLFVWIKLCIYLFPRRFRNRHGKELARLYHRVYGDRGTLIGGMYVLCDSLRDGPAAHVDSWRRRSSRPQDHASMYRVATRSGSAPQPPSPRNGPPSPGLPDLGLASARWAPWGLEFRQAARALLRRPTFSLIVIATLALGIGANTAIFSLVEGILLQPLTFPEPERLVRLWGTDYGELDVGGTLAYLDIVDFAEQASGFSAIAAYDEWTVNLTGEGDPRRLDAALVSAAYFDLLGTRPALGRFFVPEEDIDGQDRVVVLENGFWQGHFGGDPAVVGRAIRLNGRPHEVIGVAPASFEDPDLSDDARPPALWRPLGFVGVEADRLPNRGSESYVAVGRLADGVSLEAAQEEIGALASSFEQHYPASNAGRGVALISLHEQLVGDTDQSLLLLLGAVGFLLAIAIANVTSMMLGRATERADETALRAALGASRGALLRFGMVEGLLLAVLGGALGVALAHGLCKGIVAAAGSSLPRAQHVAVDARVLIFALVLSTLVGIACGVLPALRTVRKLPAASSVNRSSSAAGVLRLRGALVVFEFSLALILLYGAGLLGQSLLNLERVDVGVEARDLLTFDLAPPWSGYGELDQQNRYYEAVLDRLKDLPGVGSVSSSNILPLSGSFDGNGLLVAGQPSKEPEGDWSVQTRAVSPDFFATAGIPILRGRPLTAVDRPDATPTAVISASVAARFWPDADPIGKRVEIVEQEVEIVGVAGDTKHLALDEAPIWHIYLSRQQGVMPWLGIRQSILMRVGRAHLDADHGLAEGIRQAVWAVDPEIPIGNLRSMQQIVDRTTRQPRLQAIMTAIFAGLAIMLSAIGIYGVASYSIALERRALAVRMALGADRARIAWHVLRRVATWATLGAILGLGGAWMLGRTLEAFLFQVGTLDLWPLSLVPLLAAVALIAAWGPARKALSIAPASVLRGE